MTHKHSAKFRDHMIATMCGALSLLWISSCPAIEPDELIKQFYKSREEDVRRVWDTLRSAMNAERDRKAKAGEPALTPKEIADGLSAVRFLVYNQATFQVLCAERSMASGKPAEEALKTTHECIDEKQDQLNKYLKLEEYIQALGEQAFLRCEMRSRDFKNEIRFPPYDFLRDTKAPRLLDFSSMNECLVSANR